VSRVSGSDRPPPPLVSREPRAAGSRISAAAAPSTSHCTAQLPAAREGNAATARAPERSREQPGVGGRRRSRRGGETSVQKTRRSKIWSHSTRFVVPVLPDDSPRHRRGPGTDNRKVRRSPPWKFQSRHSHVAGEEPPPRPRRKHAGEEEPPPLAPDEQPPEERPGSGGDRRFGRLRDDEQDGRPTSEPGAKSHLVPRGGRIRRGHLFVEPAEVPEQTRLK